MVQSVYDPMGDDQKRVPARFWRTKIGKEPVREWLRSLGKDDRKAIGTDIKTVEYGWPVGMPVCRPLRSGLFEVCTDLDNRIARVLFCFDDGAMILLHGFIKKVQQTPPSDLKLARSRKRTLR